MRANQPVVLDTSLLLTLSAVGALERLLAMSRYEWHVTPMIRTEVTRRTTRAVIDRAIAGGQVRLTAVDIADQSEMNAWAEWEQLVDVGQAEAIALVLARRWVIGLDDRYAQRLLDHRIGSGCWLDATSVLLTAVADGAMSFDESMMQSCRPHPITRGLHAHNLFAPPRPVPCSSDR